MPMDHNASRRRNSLNIINFIQIFELMMFRSVNSANRVRVAKEQGNGD
jgi:hypothetical protein